MSDEAVNMTNESIIDKILKKRILVNDKGNPELTPETTGRVIIANDKGQEDILEGVYFSNMDFNWYDADGNRLTELMENYHGRKWSLRFTMNDNDKFGKKHEFTSQFIAPLGIGVMGPIDWQGIRGGEYVEASFGIEKGAFSGYDDPYLKSCLGRAACSFVTYSNPNKKMTEIEPCILFIALALHIDEQLDNNIIFNKQLTFEEINTVRDKMVEVLYGERDPEEQHIDFEFPLMKPICRYLCYMRESILKRAATREIAERCLLDMHEYLNAVTVMNSAEWNDYKAQCRTRSHQRAELDLRRLDSGTLSAFTCQLICYDNRLYKKIYDSQLFQHLKRSLADHTVYVNDLFSYRREIINKETRNTVYTRHHEEGGDFVEVLQSCVDDANNAAIDMTEIGNLLMKLHKNDKQLEQAIYLLKAFGAGHILWYNYALQYHYGVIFDCVIHPEEDSWNWTFMDKDREEK